MYPTLFRYDLWGRATGKSMGLAYDSAKMAHEMPGASFVFAGKSYALLEGITLPGIVAGWKQLGYHNGYHYEIQKKPNKNKMWPEPFIAPLSYDYFIPWYTGAGFYLASQDKAVPFRGPSVEGIYVDEALTINKIKFDEEIGPTNRGNRFKHPLNHFFRFASTKPFSSDSNWLYKGGDYYGEYMLQIRRYQRELIEMQLELVESEEFERQKYLFKEIQKVRDLVKFYPNKDGKILYTEFNAFDNIKNLGLKYFVENRKVTSLLKFRVEYLNETLDEVENGFYGNLSSKHFNYDTFNYSHLDLLTYEQKKQDNHNWKWDNDLFFDMPLKVVVDWGGWINNLLVWQRSGKLLNFTNHLFVKHPGKIRDLASVFIKYYKGFPRKQIHLFYDVSGNSKKDNSVLTSAQEFEGYLVEAGWHVIRMSKGAAPTHEEKYHLNQLVLSESNEKYPTVRINANNCSSLITSMKLTPLKRTSTKIEKDKSSERDPSFPQEQATHPGDCFDIVIYNEASRKKQRAFIDPLM